MPRAIEEIRSQLAAKQVVAVVGAGVSVAASGDAQCASWRSLLIDGVEHCSEFGNPRLRNEELDLCAKMARSEDVDLLLAAASVIESRLEAPKGAEWRRWLKRSIGALKLEDTDLIGAIRGLGVPIVTTNYDSLLQTAPPENPTPAVTWRNTPAWVDVLAGNNTGILHLHGWWDEPESVVFGIKSYENVLNASAAQEIQRALGRFNSLLFIGYGAGIADPNFGPLLRWLAESDPPNHRHYILLRSDEAKEFETGAGLHPVEYGPTFEFLPRFLRELSVDDPSSLTSSVRRDIVSLVKPGEAFSESENPPTPRMIVLPPGTCEMGSIDPGVIARAEEGPRHVIHLDYSFAVSRTPITFDHWDTFVAASGLAQRPRRDAGWGRGSRPVINVNWYEALEYTEWLNSLPDIEGTYRLLSEAEWEYAARAGTSTRYWWGEDIDELRANYDDARLERTTPVDTYPPNQFGLQDMLGNVWEWTQDTYNPSYVGAPDDGSSWVADTQRRVIRGGCWYYDASFLAASARLGMDTSIRFNSIGFRVARTIRQSLRNHERYAIISVGSGLAATRVTDHEIRQCTYAVLPEQVWEFEEVEDAVFVLRDPQSDWALSVSPPIDRNLSAVTIEEPSGEVVQQWEALPDGDGYLLRNRASGKVLDVDGVSSEDGTQIIQFAKHGNANQRWWIRPAR
jgi:formylglycine-generating enzyme required for sulfatase activity